MMKHLADRLVTRADRLLPNRVTASREGQPAMFRWELIPLNRWFNIYVHKFVFGDDGRALHDHPWWGLSIVLRGRYVDVTKKGRRVLEAGQWLLRPARRAHRIELLDGEPCWTLFIVGPRIRDWGFHCPGGWVNYRQFNVTGCD